MEGDKRKMESTKIISPIAQVSIFKRGQNVQLTNNFHLREFECKCGECAHTLVDLDHVDRLEKLRRFFNRKITITSGFRCAEYNKVVGGVLDSQHTLGTATDIQIKDATPWEVYTAAIGIFDGVGVYDTFVHVDSRSEEARWDKRTRKV